MIGPQTRHADMLHAMKYRVPGEDFREAMNRVAFGTKDSDAHYQAFREILLDMRFMPGGRIQAAIGLAKATTPYNCYVSGTIDDSFVEGLGSIMERAKEAAATMRMGGGIGYDFSTLRPRGDIIRKLQSHTSGPVSFMEIFDAVCRCTSSSGHRRGAQMGVLRVDHPDIEEFVKAKQNADKLTGFNISVAVTDEFMEAAIAGRDFDLRFDGRTYRTVDAAELWNSVMRSTWDWGEPGVLFIDRHNEMNNLWYCESIAATNPCAEQGLPPFGACLLGSFNLVKYLVSGPMDGHRSFDFEQLAADIPAVVRAMDNVIDRARYPLAQQKAEALTKRRMGLGVTGLANAAEALGCTYGTDDFLEFEAKVLGVIRDGCYRASAELAAEKGQFPLYDEVKYLQGRFIATLPDEVRALIRRHGIRNSHLTSIAPTGTISLCADNVSGGLEPVFSYALERPINTPEGASIARIEDYGASVLGVRGRLAADVTADQHIAVLATAQRFVDSAVSKTVNMDGRVMSWDAFVKLYQRAWELGCKGCATFNASGKRMALLSGDEGAACVIDPESGRKECA